MKEEGNKSDEDMHIIARLFSVVLILIFCLPSMTLGTEAITLTAGGTGSGIGFMRLLGDSYQTLHPEITVEVLPSLGSAGGIRALKSCAIDLAISSRPLKETEKSGINGHFLGTSPLVFAVHPDTKVADVTLAQLINIYEGTVTTWRDGIQIRRILRPVDDSDWRLMQTISPEMAKALDVASATKGLFLAVTDTDAISYLERIHGSFGPTTLAMIRAEKRRVKILSLNGVDPAKEDSNQHYSPQKPYYLVTRADASAAVVDFLDFILSEQGRKILTDAGITVANEQDHEK
ncbi:substrate-binding domain-containing protein [Desulfopila aestuarii]|uniref:Phosphate ABC transporter substrate-binding protein, PhoT family n=1 Tax=Desulfopila aestuarii DSM 18488 TaxID=1121416 RepID=A0A1M7Y4C8_9BACT|nr:substrate-binding domain-containing protein [Desulfopila aestuarii]SHO47143.1 phosphate ABC transporter substrate-binding protein, PhoT family [Desulfopila aestuarii DSM 18488]